MRPRCTRCDLVRRSLSRRGPVFTRGVHGAAVVRIEAEETVVTRAGLEDVTANGAAGLEGPRRVLNLVIDALCELRRRAHRFTQRLELPRIGSVLRRCVGRQRGPHLVPGFDGARFGLRRGIALALRHDEPQEAPDRGEENAKQHAPPQQNLLKGWLRRRLIHAGGEYRQIGAAMRANLRSLIDFSFAFAAIVHGRKSEVGTGRVKTSARRLVNLWRAPLLDSG